MHMHSFLVPPPTHDNPTCRFFATRHSLLESTTLLLAPIVFLACSKIVYQSSTVLSPLVALPLLFLLAVSSLLPIYVRTATKNQYYKWRDFVLAIHYFNQHVVTPTFLVFLGVSYRDKITSEYPTLFLSALLACQTILWFTISPLFCPMRFRVYSIVQPILLLFVSPLELGNCAWAVAHHPTTSAATFLPLRRLAEVVFTNALPFSVVKSSINPPSLSEYVGLTTTTTTNSSFVSPHGAAQPYQSSFGACRQVMGFCIFFFPYILSGFLVMKLEERMWQLFVSPTTPIESIEWAGGPSRGELGEALDELWCQEAAKLRPDRRTEMLHSVVLLFLAAAVLWQAVELLV